MSTTPAPLSPEPIVQTKSRWRRRLGEFVLLLVLVFAIRAWQQHGLVSGSAPPLQGELLNGQSLALQDFAGRPVLVHFWASWCPVCRAEQDSIAALAAALPVVTVAMQSGPRADVQQALRAARVDFPVLNDPDARIAAQWGVRAVPASFIVDGSGRIRFVEVGYTTGIGLRLRMWLAGL